MVYAQLASDGACTRLKNQHLILSCLLRIYWIFYLVFIYLFSVFLLPSINCTTGSVMVQAKNFLKKDMRKKHLLLTRVPQKCNNPQLNKLLFYYFSLVFFLFRKENNKKELFIFTFFLFDFN